MMIFRIGQLLKLVWEDSFFLLMMICLLELLLIFSLIWRFSLLLLLLFSDGAQINFILFIFMITVKHHSKSAFTH